MEPWLPKIWIAVVAAAVVVPFLIVQFRRWILMPLKIKQTQTVAASLKLEPTKLEHTTPEMRGFLGKTIGQFREEGFEVAGNFRNSGTVPGVESVVLMLVNRTTSD